MDAFIIQNRIVMHFFCLLKASVHSLEGQCMHAKSLHLCPTLCDPMDCSPPGSSVHEVLQARILEWVPMPSSRESPNPGMKPVFLISPALAGRCFFFVVLFFTTSASWEALRKAIIQYNHSLGLCYSIWLPPATHCCLSLN